MPLTHVVNNTSVFNPKRFSKIYKNVYTNEQKKLCGVLSVIEDCFSDFDYDIKDHNFNLNELDAIDFLDLVINCESYYDISLWDIECELLENFTIMDLNDLFVFVNGGVCSDNIHIWITKNIGRVGLVRPIYKEYIRDRNINDIFN